VRKEKLGGKKKVMSLVKGGRRSIVYPLKEGQGYRSGHKVSDHQQKKKKLEQERPT